MDKEKVTKETIDFVAETLKGDIRDAMLNEIRTQKKPYARYTQSEQQDVIDHVTKVADHFVERAVELIASHGRTTIMAVVEQFVVKDGIKLVAKCANIGSTLSELGDCVGKAVFLVVADKSQFTGEEKPAVAEPDQQVIPLHVVSDKDGDGVMEE